MTFLETRVISVSLGRTALSPLLSNTVGRLHVRTGSAHAQQSQTGRQFESVTSDMNVN